MKFRATLVVAGSVYASHCALPALCLAEQAVPTMVAPDVDATLIRQPPAAERADETRQLKPEREGAYFRIAAGSGLFWALSDGPSERRFTANTLSIFAAAGGTPSRYIVIGGMLAADRAILLEATDKQNQDVDLEGIRFYMLSIGPFVELYPVLPHGLHIGLGAFFSDLNVHRRVGGQILEADDDPVGLSFMLSAGYEWRVGSKLHVGALARVLYAPLQVDETGTDVDVTVWVPALLLSATLH